MLLSKIQALKTGLHEVKNIVIENLTSQKSQQYLTEELVENQKEREIQKKLCESYVAVHEPTLLELEDSRKIQKEQEEKINILTEENKKFIEIRQKLNEENEKLCEELGEMKRKLEDFEEKKTFQIFIKIRHYITLDMKKSDTIADVKKKLFKRGVFCNNCLLVYGDVILVVNKKEFYVLRKFLAAQSSFFKALLLGNFAESKKLKVTLTGIDPDDFHYFLEVLYGELAIDGKSFYYSDMYDAKTATRRCENFLLKESKKSLKKKLEMATRYHLENLKNNCMEKIKTIEDVRSVLPANINDLDHNVMGELLRKRYITLDVKKSDTIVDVKEKMCKKGILCNDFLLVYRGKAVE
ncbi:hypothetical protein L3Y34_019168 [Caenorhabditis briggsae]|uniref:BTB domain-containing protein n=1 Tax=Caenorhabditis briggsae TaxID=6238 RepID=A0AAE9DPA1_CAEBR|nr:hypothetical protein L3Y34_019168 [Caenorhabditis briggsae]